MYEKQCGNKYEETKDIGVKDVAKLARQDIKAAVKNGTLPKGKYSVRIERFAGGQAIDITVKAIDCQVISPKYFLYNDDRKHGCRFTETATQTIETLKGILNAYNYDASEIMTDYFDKKFYVHSTFDYDLLQSETEKAKAIYENAIG